MRVLWVGQATHPTCQQTSEEVKLREFVDAAQRGDEKAANELERQLNAPRKSPALGSMALWYANVAKWPVFPCLPGEKRPACKNGFRDATRDPEKIRAWWGSNPNFNIGIPTGPDTFDCIDVDGPAGVQSLAELGDDVIPEVHGKVSTPRGLHILVRGTNDGNRVNIRPGLDYRSAGGFVIGGGSVVNGRRYEWIVKPSPEIYGKTP
jgi:hypothetical protein